MGRMLGIMEYDLRCHHYIGKLVITRNATGVCVSIPVGEIATRDFYSNAMPGLKDIARAPDLNGQLVNLKGFE
jgi:hypothetical protein